VAIKPKVYSYRLNTDKETKKMKGISKSYVKKNIRFENYKQ